MRLFGILLVLAPGCLSRSYPQVARVVPVEPRLPLERRQHNLTLSGQSGAHLDRRVLFPDDHPLLEAVAQGCSLIGMMATQDEVAARFIRPAHTYKTAASPWTDWNSLHDWGYDLDDDFADEFYIADLRIHLDVVMHDLGLPRLEVVGKGGSAEPRAWDHNRVTTHNGIEYRVTGAWYHFLMDVEHGLILATVTYGPEHEGIAQNPPVTVLPKLKNLFDILYLDYEHLAIQHNVPVNRLKYYIVENVRNPTTRAAVNFALKFEITEWECFEHTWENRHVFYPDDEGYKALISSPSGRSAALILATHKTAFGERRMIESVTFFCQNGDEGNYDLLFTVKDHDEEEDDSDWEDEETEDPGNPDFSVSPWPEATAAVR
ncbi:hypothetical protein PMIN06_011265 [Paraphaeosphaeria minitans]